MSLDFSFKDIEDKSFVWDAKGNILPFTEWLVFSTMFVGIRELNAKTVKEFELRLMIGFETGIWTDKKPPTTERLEHFFGLKTNATPKTKAQFRNDVWRIIHDRATRSVQKHS